MSAGNPLKWTVGENRITSIEVGYIVSPSGTRLRLFTLDFSLHRGHKPYVLRSTLPGYSTERQADSIEDGKQMAERIYQRFRTIVNTEDGSSNGA